MSIILEPCNAFRRRIVYQMVEDEYGDVAAVTKEPQLPPQRGLARLRITLFPSTEAKASHDRAKLQSDLAESRAKLNIAVGVRHIFDAISDSRKPVIGHNCYLDLAHIFQKFHGPLPETLLDFTHIVHKYFPCIIDTKHLLSANPNLNRKVRGQTSLGDAFSAMTADVDEPDTPISAAAAAAVTTSTSASAMATKPLFKFAEGFDTYKNSEARQHEAAYDAYMTGIVFASAAHYIGMDAYDLKSWANTFAGQDVSGNGESNGTGIPHSRNDMKREFGSLWANDNVYGLTNQLFLMRLGDASLQLGPLSQRVLDRSLYVHVTGHPHAAQTGDFYRAFRCAGTGVRRVHWVDDNNLFLQMNDADGVTAALSRSFVKPKKITVNEEYDPLASLDGDGGKDDQQENHALGDLFDLQIQTYDAFQASLLDSPVGGSNEAISRQKRAREDNSTDEGYSSSKKRKTADSDDSVDDNEEKEESNASYCTIV